MRIAITGATGFIGSHLVRHLSAAGHSILAIGRSPQPPAALRSYAAYQTWDIRTAAPVEFQGDIVIHAAAVVEFSGDQHDMYATNVLGTENVLRWASSARQVIIVSSSSVYPTTADRRIKKETDAGPAVPGTYYGQTKLQAEKLAIDAAQQQSVTILRPHGVYGPGDQHLLPTLVRRIRRNTFFLPGNGRNQFSITHIGNFCTAISNAIDHPVKNLVIANIADAHPLPLGFIVHHTFRALGLTPRIRHIHPKLARAILPLIAMLSKKQPPGDETFTRDLVDRFSNPWVVSLDQAYTHLNYHPLYSFDQGLQDIQQWIESLGGVTRLLDSKWPPSWTAEAFTYEKTARK